MTINTEILSQALQITLLGMGLVFIGLLLLWGLMEITVQLTAWYNPRHPEGEGEEEESGKPVYEETFRQARPEKQTQGGSDAVQTEAGGDDSFHTFLLLFNSSSKYFRYRTSHSRLPSGTRRESDWIVRCAAASASSSY